MGIGYDLISKLRKWAQEAGSNTPAIALTGFVSVQDRKRALAAGYQDHLPKPVDTDQLIELLLGFTSSGISSNSKKKHAE